MQEYPQRGGVIYTPLSFTILAIEPFSGNSEATRRMKDNTYNPNHNLNLTRDLIIIKTITRCLI